VPWWLYNFLYMNILLLNPPGKKLYVRDYYCSKTSKANYIYHPIDLLLLSGILASRHNVDLIDAIVERLSPDDCLNRIANKRPDAIIALTGAVSIKEDISFFEKLKKRSGNIPIYASGDILMEDGAEFLKKVDCVEGIILDFTSNEILKLLDGIQGPFGTIIYKNGNSIVGNTGKFLRGEFSLPIPRYKLFRRNKYTYPFINSSPFATVLTDYGCPYRCSFCIMGTLPYKYRSVENIMEELEYVHSLGMKEIYFGDQTFGIIRKRTINICQKMIEKRFGFGWVCFSRVDITDEEILKIMREAGCHTIIYGVETGNDELLKKYGKDISKVMIKKTFTLCKKNGINTVGTFLLGLPEDNRESILKTIEFSKELDCDYASFNVYVPRMNTRLREEVLKMGLISADVKVMDQSGSYSIIGTKYLSSAEVLKLKNKAVRDFYLRPRYIIRRLSRLKSSEDIIREIRGGLGVLKDVVAGFYSQK